MKESVLGTERQSTVVQLSLTLDAYSVRVNIGEVPAQPNNEVQTKAHGLSRVALGECHVKTKRNKNGL